MKREFWGLVFRIVIGITVFSDCENAIAESKTKTPKVPLAVSKIKPTPAPKIKYVPEEEKISLDFPEPVEVRELLKTIAQWTNKNVIADSKILGQIQILGPKKVTKEEAYEALISALDHLSLALVETGSLIRIQPKRETLVGSYTPVIPIGELRYTDRVYTQIFPIKNITAEYARHTLTRVVSSSTLIVYEPTNSIILTETGSNLRKAAEIIELVDQNKSMNIEFVRIKHTHASEIEKWLKEFFKDDVTLTGNSLKIILIEDKNTLVFSGPVEKIKRAREYIAQFDKAKVESDDKRSKIYVRPLNFSDAKKVATTLNSIAPTSRPNDDEKLQISADEATNSLLFKGPYQAFRSMGSIVRKLDEQKEQVFLECDILTVSEDNNFNFLPSLLGGVAKADGSGSKVIVGYEVAAMTPLIVAQANQNASGSVNATDIKGATSAFSKNFTVGTFPGGNLKVPGFGTITPGALINIMKSDANTKILSSPQILAMNNEEASFSAGETYVFTTSKHDDFGNITSSPQKENVELTLKVKPILTSSAYLSLQVELDTMTVDSFFEGGIPQISKKKARQLVNFKNGQTILISGIQNLSRLNSKKKIPLLGDIPLLGYLFSGSDIRNSTDYTFIFITGHVVRGANDLQEIYDKKFKEKDPRQSRIVMHSSESVQEEGQGGLE